MFPIVSALLFLGGAATFGLGVTGVKKIREVRAKDSPQTRVAKKKLQQDLDGLKISLRSRIDEEIQEVLVDAEELRRHLATDVQLLETHERRFSLRVILMPTEMNVYWKDRSGLLRQGYVKDASLTGISFDAPESDVDSIVKITVPSLRVSLAVKKADVTHRGVAEVAVAFIEFEDNEDSWLVWVDLMTRVGQASSIIGAVS